jgi:hypothetical protein
VDREVVRRRPSAGWTRSCGLEFVLILKWGANSKGTLSEPVLVVDDGLSRQQTEAGWRRDTVSSRTRRDVVRKT